MSIILYVADEQHMNMREWRNWQTRTFEGRVVTPYGFKSRFSHHKKALAFASAFLLLFYLLTASSITSSILNLA